MNFSFTYTIHSLRLLETELGERLDRNMLKDNNKARRGPPVLRKLTIILFDAEKVFLEVGARFSQ